MSYSANKDALLQNCHQKKKPCSESIQLHSCKTSTSNSKQKWSKYSSLDLYTDREHASEDDTDGTAEKDSLNFFKVDTFVCKKHTCGNCQYQDM